MQTGKYEDARAHLEKFLSYPKTSDGLKKNAQLMLKSCGFAAVAVKNPVPFKPVNMGPSINTSYDEYFPAITADGNTFLFTRNLKRTDRTGMAISQEDFFVSKKSDGKWQSAENMGPPVNSDGNEGAPSLGADGQVLFFTACMEAYGYPGDRKGFGSCDIFISRMVGSQWVHASNLGGGVNTLYWESQPSFSSDGKTLYFVRGTMSRSGREKEQDIYLSQLQADGKWGVAAKLSDKINTPGREESVFIHPDNQTLYFSSDGHPGMGGLDIFVSRRQPDGSWGEPVNLGYPINTADEESSLLVGPGGNIAYFSSTRDGGYGGEDLYEFELYDKARPAKITYVRGKVFDSKTKNPLGADFEMIDLETGATVVQSQSNKGNGEFLICLPAGKNYALSASKQGYLFYSENFSLKEHSSGLKTYSLDVPLKPIEVGISEPMRNVFFDTDKYDLKPESKSELNKLAAFMAANPKIKIELGGHTDNTGDKKKNITLSQNRAKAVYDFLLAAGITADRLSYKGFGDSVPIASNDNDEGKARNRRTEYKITAN
jgi:outer membrane protein OmpA-like peptidoglycan-associated protein